MTDHYSAFISYKHAPEDNIVAEAVHKGLERFHIPHKIRKKTGIKRINRIFRDKDELPITSDLSDSISNALTDAKYLIVICSTNTKESAWVPREIEYFLRNHSKRDIFTVLVNGEPYEVIPEILTYEETVVKDEDGNERTVRIPIEPLSCDFRTSLRKAKKTELPRLACGIIGCGYDELMNRRRQYRIKQLTAIFSIILALAVGFSGYMYYSRDKIHKNYLESLRNQSRYLANESKNLLEKEQRITALQLALEALPKSEEDDRPVTAEAVKALTDATLAYVGSDGKNINAAWNYQMPGYVSVFRLSGDGKKIAILDDGNVIGVWNTEDHKRTLYIDDNDSRINGIGFVSDDALAFWDSYEIRCYDVNKGEELWKFPYKEDTFGSDDNPMVLNDSLFICTSGNDYLKLNTKTGELQETYSLPEKEGFEDFSVVESKLSPDGKKIVFRGMGGFDIWNNYAYGVLDLNSKEAYITDIAGETVKDLEWIDNNTFMVSSSIVDMSSSMSFGSSELISSDRSEIRCVNASDISEKWKAEFVCNGVMIESGFVKLGTDKVAYYSGNVITVYDSVTGQEQYSNNVNNSVIDVNDKDGDGEPVYITENGGYAIPALNVDTDAVYYDRYFTDELRQAIVSNGVYVRQRYGREVIYYGVHVYDEDWTQLCDDAYLTGSMSDYYIDDDYLAILSTDNEKRTMLDVFGLGENADRFTVNLEAESPYYCTLLGVKGDCLYLGNNNSGFYDLITVDLKEKTLNSEPFFDMSPSFNDALVMKDGKFIYVYKTEDFKKILVIKDIETGEKKEITVSEEVGYISDIPVYYRDLGIVCLEGDSEYVVDIQSDQISKLEVPDGWTEAGCWSDNSLNGKFAVSDGKKILLSGKDGKVTLTIGCPGLVPLGMSFIGDELAVLYNDGGLFRYKAGNGEFVSRTEVSMYYGYNGKVYFDNDTDNDLLFIRMDNITDVIDMNSTVEITSIIDCFGHVRKRDIFVTKSRASGEDPKVGYYRRYTVEELISKAHEILGEAELTDQVKSRYGIE
ncbi:MAG: TIR domain-containing protein [Lachnospiraceae bacterium]|nr:TIR domain-containing protein [Lachnospiraceae bacterium]